MIAIQEYRARIGCFLSKTRKSMKFKRPRRFNRDRPTQTSFYLTVFFKICLMFLFIVALRWKVNMAFLKLCLLLDGDIESNPGPATSEILKVVSGTFNQGHPKFANTAGIQCACNALYAICFSIIKKVSVWKSYDLDYILENGNETFKIVGIPRSLAMNELPLNIMIENCNIAVEFLGNQFGLLGNNNLFEGHASCDTGNGLIFTTGGFQFFNHLVQKLCFFI